MPNLAFGVSGVWAVPSVAVPTPVQFGTIQKASVTISRKLVPAQGNLQFPVDMASATGSIKWSVEQMELDASRFNQVYWGAAQVIGQVTTALREPQTVPSVGPYTITVVNASFYAGNLVVLNLNTGVLLQRVASGPATGEYSIGQTSGKDNGVYTFAAADAGSELYMTYQYTTQTGANFAPVNPRTGVAPRFMLKLSNQYNDNALDLTLYNCVAGDLDLSFSNENYMIPKVSGECSQGPAGQVLQWSAAVAASASIS